MVSDEEMMERFRAARGAGGLRGVSRRGWLSGVGAAAGAAALAACGTAQGATPKPAPTPGLAPTAAGQLSIPGMGVVAGPFPGEAKSLTGAGATFPAVLYTKWFTEYNRLTKVEVNYQSIGSGGGIKAIQDMTTDFGASDSPMSDDQLKEAKGGEVLHIPMTLGATVVTYNVPEVGNAKLKFTGDTIAGIFLGDIKRWSDPKLKADNPGVALPDKEIITVHRSDGSGTTFNFTDYLSAASADWKGKIGASTTVNWPSGLGGKGSEGVTGEVKQNPYAIGYVELIYAIQNKLGYGLVKNKAGQFVEPTLEGVSAAAAGAAATVAPDLRVSIVDAAGDKSYPISTFTWILAYKEMKEEAKATALARLLWWGTHDGQQLSGDLGYAPLPAALIEKAEAKIKAITAGGKPAFPNK